MANLVQKSDGWIVTYILKAEVVNQRFATIELAADFLNKKLNISDDAIDDALCEMVAYDHKRAIFGDKGYSHSEEK